MAGTLLELPLLPPRVCGRKVEPPARARERNQTLVWEMGITKNRSQLGASNSTDAWVPASEFLRTAGSLGIRIKMHASDLSDPNVQPRERKVTPNFLQMGLFQGSNSTQEALGINHIPMLAT